MMSFCGVISSLGTGELLWFKVILSWLSWVDGEPTFSTSLRVLIVVLDEFRLLRFWYPSLAFLLPLHGCDLPWLAVCEASNWLDLFDSFTVLFERFDLAFLCKYKADDFSRLKVGFWSFLLSCFRDFSSQTSPSSSSTSISYKNKLSLLQYGALTTLRWINPISKIPGAQSPPCWIIGTLYSQYLKRLSAMRYSAGLRNACSITSSFAIRRSYTKERRIEGESNIVDFLQRHNLLALPLRYLLYLQLNVNLFVWIMNVQTLERFSLESVAKDMNFWCKASIEDLNRFKYILGPFDGLSE